MGDRHFYAPRGITGGGESRNIGKKAFCVVAAVAALPKSVGGVIPPCLPWDPIPDTTAFIAVNHRLYEISDHDYRGLSTAIKQIMLLELGWACPRKAVGSHTETYHIPIFIHLESKTHLFPWQENTKKYRK